MTDKLPCPHCSKETTVHAYECYCGEMRECKACEFMAYWDEWENEQHKETWSFPE